MAGWCLAFVALCFASYIDLAQAQFRCFSDNCTTLAVEQTISAEDCCVNTPNGMFYNDGTSNGQCFQCIVYGWESATFMEQESQTLSVTLGYFKGPSRASFFVTYRDTQEGNATSSEDYMRIAENFEVLIFGMPVSLPVSFITDNIALEGNEIVILDMVINAVQPAMMASQFNPNLTNVFFQQRITLIILDGTELTFQLNENDRNEPESNGFIEVVVGESTTRDLAKPLRLVLTPRTVGPDFEPPPPIILFGRANTHVGRVDFNDTPIVITIPAGRVPSEGVSAFVPIYDDAINEAREFFVADLSFEDPDSVPDVISLGNRQIRLSIVDNDDIFIGFQLQNTTYPEVEATHQITLVKGLNNITELNIPVSLTLQVASFRPPGTPFSAAQHMDPDNDNDFQVFAGDLTQSPLMSLVAFESDKNTSTVSITIFNDELPEATESAQLRLSIPTDTLTRFEILPQFANFFIIIADDDRFRVGFETLSYTVNEGIRFQEVCVRMFEPSDETPIDPFFSIALITVSDSADQSDYEARGFSLGSLLLFRNTQRRTCVDITIEQDSLYENDERFFLQLADFGGRFALPDNFVLSPNMSEIIIQDNELVTVGFIDPPYTATEEEGVMVFTVGVISDHTLGRNIELSFSTDDIGDGEFFATAGLDYSEISDLIFVLNGSMMTFEIRVPVLMDDLFEPDESFQGILTLISGERVTVDPEIANATIIATECDALPPLTNGRIEYSPDMTAPYLEGTNAEHICNPGFSLIGNMIRVCQNDSTFSGEPPMCTPIQCLELPGIENGRIEYDPDERDPNFGLETVATYSCNNGYILDTSNGGSMTRTCVDDMDNDAEGIFNNQAPRCIPVCQELDLLTNGRIVYSPDTTAPYLEGTNAEHICNPGFFLIGNVIRVCQNDSTFSGAPPTCTPIQCLELPGIENGRIEYDPDERDPNFGLETVATYSCNNGYILDTINGGSMTRTCVDDLDNDAEGIFNNQAPRCIPVCQELDLLTNGRIVYSPDTTAPYLEGTNAEHICNPGFFLIGNVIRVCQNDSTFSGAPPTCTPIQCLELPGIENGRIEYDPDERDPNFGLETVATYSCNNGYILDTSNGGSMTRICVNDMDNDAEGIFNNQAPRCIPVCQELDLLTNGRIVYSPDTTAPYLEGTNAEHICNPGYILIGNVIRVCQNDTTFSGVPPTCTPIQCLELPGIENGRIEYDPDERDPNFGLETVATYSCNNGYILDTSNGGSVTRTCVDDMDNDAEGIFNNQAPRCIPVCQELDLLTNGRIEYSPDTTAPYLEGTNAEHICNPGFSLIGNVIRVCQNDTTFSGVPPMCTLVNVIRVNDTVIGDPLMTVPLYVRNSSSFRPPLGADDILHLCFEIHGNSDAYFNLVSDDCVSVNAHYQQIAPGEDINVIDDVSIRAVANDGVCHNIEVLLDQCTARVDGVVINSTYSSEGISVKRYPSRVRIAVPNCSPMVRNLVMWVMCQSQTFWSTSRVNEDGSEFTFEGEAIRFVVARGLNLREESHGILGQFWNIPIDVERYNGPFVEEPADDEATYAVTINYPEDSEPRQFIGWLRFPSWEYERQMYCLYAGGGHGGHVYEVPEGPPNGPVIEGDYTDYIVSEQFGTDFRFSHFQADRCL